MSKKKFKDLDAIDEWADPQSKSERYSLMRTNSGWWGAWDSLDSTIARLISKDRSVAIAELEQMNSDRDSFFRWPTTSRNSGHNYDG